MSDDHFLSNDEILSDFKPRQHETDDEGWAESDQIEPSHLIEDDLCHEKSSVVPSSPPRPSARMYRRSQVRPRLRLPSSSPELPSPTQLSYGSVFEDGENIIVTPKPQRAQITNARAQATAAARSVSSPARKKRARSTASILSQDRSQSSHRAVQRQRLSKGHSSHRSSSPADEMDCDAAIPDQIARKNGQAFGIRSDKFKPQYEPSRKASAYSDDEDDDEDHYLPTKPECMSPLDRYGILLQTMGREEMRALPAGVDNEELVAPASTAGSIEVEPESKLEPDSIKHESEVQILIAGEQSSDTKALRSDGTREDSAMSILEASAHEAECLDEKVKVEAKLEDTQMEDQDDPGPASAHAQSPVIEDGTVSIGPSPASGRGTTSTVEVEIESIGTSSASPLSSQQPTVSNAVFDMIARRQEPRLQHIPELVTAPAESDQDQRELVAVEQNHVESQTTAVPATPEEQENGAQHVVDAQATESQATMPPWVRASDEDDNARQVANLLLEIEENALQKQQAMWPFDKKELDIKKELLRRGHQV